MFEIISLVSPRLFFVHPDDPGLYKTCRQGDLRKPGAHLVAEFGSDRNEYSNLDPQIVARIQSPDLLPWVGWLVGSF